jgi:uncharacterized protein YndB with AHSA1/START domain
VTERSVKKIEFTFERVIPAGPDEVYDAWLEPTTPGNPWHESDKLILNPEVDGLFYWLHPGGTAHYGRFTKTERGAQLQHTWVSPNTLGEESVVTVTFKRKGEDTVMTLVHSDLPDADVARSHESGWNYFLGLFSDQFAAATSRQ